MNLRELGSTALHREAEKAAEHFQDSVARLLVVLDVVDEKQIYLEFGFASLFRYCVEILKLSPSISYELISVINKGRDVPRLKEAVLDGRLSLSKAKKICSVITDENDTEWIELAQTETSRVIEKCVASANPKECVREQVSYKQADRLEFKLGVSEKWVESLAAVKDLLSQKLKRAISSEEALERLMNEFVVKNDPVQKAHRVSARTEQVPGTVRKSPRQRRARKPISRITIHEVNARDENRCTFIGTHGRCGQKRWLDIHHIIPISSGGTNTLGNLTTLCSAHHNLIHRKQKSTTLHR